MRKKITENREQRTEKKRKLSFAICHLLFAILLLLPQAKALAAPPTEYEGFGAVTRGALAAPGGYTTYHVTTLNDSGAGSLRDALSAGSRLVVFDVGGNIALTSSLHIRHSYITIDGSTAPAPGITILVPPAPPTVTFQIYASIGDITDIIVKYIRLDGQADFHPDSGGGDILAITADGAYSIKNVVIDHVTAKRGQDGVFDTRWDVSNMTISYCFVYDTQAPTIINGGTTEGRNINGVSWHHNVYAKCDGRQPLLQRMVTNFDAVNNVVFGWGYFGAGEGGMLIENVDGIVNPDAEFTKNNYHADYDAPYAIGHAGQGAIHFFYNGTWGTADDCKDRGNITFNENLFPPEEDEDVSYGVPTVIPEEYKPTEYDPNTLGDTVVPYVGTHYPTQEEQDLLNEISIAIGGQGYVPQPQWTPPIGIPKPEFGIDETYRMYDDPANRNPNLTYTQNSEGGYYTHYVDMNDVNATDTGNPYGSIAVPRLTVPTTIPAGSVVEIHGGSYGNNVGSKLIIRGIGTKEKPVFIRGVSELERPVFTGDFHPQGSYMIIENLYLYHTRIIFRVAYSAGLPGPIDHIAARNSEVEGDGTSPGTTAISIWSSETEEPNNIVIYNNHIHHRGDYQASEQDDAMGVAVGNTQNVWIVDNHIHHNGGDSVQVQSTSAKYIYIGRNLMHEDRENAVDIKQSEHVIISENEMYGYVPCSSSDGSAVVIHYNPTLNIWITHNHIYDSQGAIRSSSGPPDLVYITNNIIHNITGTAIQFWNNGEVYTVGNTIYDSGGGISGSSVALYASNNIIANLKSSSSTHLGVSSSTMATASDASYNLFYQEGGEVNIYWAGSTYNVSEFKSAFPDKSEGCIEADPLFVDAENNDFHLQPTSPAIDAGTSSGVVQQVFDRFQQLYGIDIRKDIEGRTRPQGSGWDIGAYEYAPQGAFLYGDVSGNGEISAYDAALAAHIAVDLEHPDIKNRAAAEVSGDGEVSAYDAALIAQKAVGLISKFPVE